MNGRRSTAPASAKLALALFLAGAVGTAGAAPWDGAPFTSDPKALLEAASAVPAPADAAAIILARESRYVFEEDGKVLHTGRLVYRVLTQAGVAEWASIEVPWAPWHNERPELRARVVTTDGAVHLLDPATIADSSVEGDSAEIYSDRRIVRAPLPAVAPGAVIEYTLSSAESAPIFDKGTVTYYYLASHVPVHRARLELDAPSGLPLRHVARLLPGLEPARTEEGGRVRLVFEGGPFEAVKGREPFAPPDTPAGPCVAFSTGESWSAVAARYGAVVDAQLGSADLKGFARKAAGDAKEPAEIANRLLQALQREVRYTGVEFGEAAIVPRSPGETLKRRYGDCKDQAALLVAMLRAAGLPAFVALLEPGPGPDVEPGLPGLGSFGHAIVQVPLDPPLWIDPTIPFSRAGVLPPGDQGRLALVARPGTAALVPTPRTAAADNRNTETREFFLAEEGPARVVETSETTGSIEQELRDSCGDTEPAKLRDRMEQYVKAAYSAKSLTSMDHLDPRDFSRPFWLKLEAAQASRGFSGSSDAAVAIPLGAIAGRLSTVADSLEPDEDSDGTDEERKTDAILPESFVNEWRYRIVPAPGFTPRPLPEGGTETLGAATLVKEFSAAPDGVVSARLRFEIAKTRLTPAEVRELRSALDELRKREPFLITFDQAGEVDLAAGRIREAIGQFQKLAALHPAEALHRSQISRALLAGGMGEAARSEARRAVELEPDNARAHTNLGFVLDHDLVGRQDHRGFDYAGAEAAYRRAKELDPKYAANRADLAILLEHDAEGRRYSAKARLSEAVREYQELRRDLDEKSMDQNLLIAMGWDREFAELEKFARTLPRSTVRDAWLLIAVAAQRGSADAVAEAARLGPDSSTRRLALAAAGPLLIQLRFYPEAVAVLTEAARGASDGAALLSQADMARRMRRHEDVTLPENEPQTVVKKLLLLIFSNAWESDDALRALISTESAGRPPNAKDLEGYRDLRRTIGGSTFKLFVSPDTFMDIALAIFEMRSDGDDATGYRIRMTAPSVSGSKAESAFVVLEKGAYRLVPGPGPLDSAGLEAFRRVRAGDFDGARRWLDWASEEVPAASKSDVLSEHPFAKLYTRGAGQPPDELREAAASLVSSQPYADEAIGILRAAIEKDGPEERRLDLERALAAVYSSTEKWPELAATARTLMAAKPRESFPYRLLRLALSRPGGWDELRKAAEQRLASMPDDPDAIRSLATLVGMGKAPERKEWSLQRVIDLGKAEGYDYNNLAWHNLVLGESDERTIALARTAANFGGQPHPAEMHTLAALCAEAGKTTEAREIILRAMELRDSDEPRPEDWYVFGRLAEQYGVPEAAVPAYKRVARPEQDPDRIDSTWALARRRLTAIEQPKKTVSH